MSEWREVRLRDVLRVKHGYAFPGADFGDQTAAPQLVTPGNFAIGGGFQEGKPKSFSGEVPAEYVLAPGDVVVTMTDLSKKADTLGYSATIPAGRTYLHNQRIGLIEIIDRARIDQRFLNYYLRTRSYRSYIVATASGSTVKHTSPSRIESYEGLIPPLREQRAIAEVLGALDDKIEANRKLAATADALAGALVRNASQDSWLRLDEVAQITMGTSPKGEFLNESGEGLPFFQGIRDFGLRYPSRRVYATTTPRTAEPGDVLVSVRAPVGTLNLAPEKLCIGRGVAALQPYDSRPYLLFHLLRAIPAVWSRFNADGTVFGSINRGQLAGLQVPSLTEASAAEIEAELQAVERRLAIAIREADTLATFRDALLPNLMSGQLRVEVAAEMAGL